MRYLALSAVLAAFLAFAAPASASFGLEEFDVTYTNQDGSPALQAGSHPFQMTTSVFFNKLSPSESDGEVKDFIAEQIAGLVADPTAVPRCTTVDFLTFISNGPTSQCPNDTAVGYAATRTTFFDDYSPVFNLVPSPGAVAKLGFIAANTPVTLEVGLNEQSPYNGRAAVTNIPQSVNALASVITLWGNPSDPAHDPYRGRCVSNENQPNPPVIPEGPYPDPLSYGNCPTGEPNVPFLTLPRACQGPLGTSFMTDSWQNPGADLANGLPNLADPNWVSGEVETHDQSEPPVPVGLGGCSEVHFKPEIEAQPTTHAGESPSGLDFELSLEDPGLSEPGAIAGSDIEKAVVTLPAGVTTNSSIASGLGACSSAQLQSETADSPPGAGCPESSKVGSVEVETPLLEEEGGGPHILNGAIYIAKQGDSEFHNLLTIYMVIKDPKLGIFVKQAGRVEPDPSTGQLTTTFENLPQLPFTNFHLHFREGQRAPLITPALCGKYTTEATLYPWNSQLGPAHKSASFEVASGAGGKPCAASAAQLPSSPAFSAGTLSPLAGSYSPFVLHLSREDGSQRLSSISTTLPQGLIGKLAGIPYCSEAQIAQAQSRSGEGQGALERSSPSCPAASELGTVTVGAGAGSEPFYVQGHAYLAGPYKSAPLSLEIITPAIAGPFDLGVVAVRTALQVDPVTTQITAVSDPIPTILHGLPLDVRSVAIEMSRPSFTLNPTSCEPKSITGSATSTLGQSTALSQYFQASNCGPLAFKPNLTLALNGGTKRDRHPALKSVITYPSKGAYSNVARVAVTLPASEFIDQDHIGNPCTRPVFAEEKCPKISILGHAKAWTPLLDSPLEGPVVFRSNGGERELPDIVLDLKGQIHVVLVGFVDEKHKKGSETARIRTTFAQIPDAPVSKFVLELKGGKEGLLVNSGNLCKIPDQAIVKLTAQNGRSYDTTPAVANGCSKKAGKKQSR